MSAVNALVTYVSNVIPEGVGRVVPITRADPYQPGFVVVEPVYLRSQANTLGKRVERAFIKMTLTVQNLREESDILGLTDMLVEAFFPNGQARTPTNNRILLREGYDLDFDVDKNGNRMAALTVEVEHYNDVA